ncbi:MAG: 4-hydroxythreonine-4-phosphate dehydrogenase PdxA [Nitrospira sp.]|nr:4-hydroxythreonine-4-phosphate dehydrogenase PdxA [Nitrospira sp.]
MPQADRRPILGLTMGDPAGIGPEVIAKALARPDVIRLCRPMVIGSKQVMERTVRALRLPLRTVAVKGHDSQLGRRDELPVLDPLERPLGRFPMGRISKQCGAASVAFITKAVELARAHCIHAIVTGPINKEAINKAGHDYPGHTELLADLTQSHEVGMMILGGPLKIMFVTTHVAIRRLPLALTQARIGRAIRLADRALREYFGVARPKIGVAALNPHAGEAGLFGDEERDHILPASRRAREAGIQASDPLPADTLFGKAVRGDYDGVVAMYHDQGLIPLKLLAFGRCVNLTVGLPIIRTSVDHGTAFDIAGKGVADPGSLLEAMKLAARLAAAR